MYLLLLGFFFHVNTIIKTSSVLSSLHLKVVTINEETPIPSLRRREEIPNTVAQSLLTTIIKTLLGLEERRKEKKKEKEKEKRVGLIVLSISNST
jgi:hypothetical protein